MKKKFRHIITGAFVIFQCSMQTVLADTRMIKHLDILDVWKYNYNSSHWLEQGNLKQGVVMYGEENITITSLPALLNGADWIQTAYGSKNFNKDVAATFELVGDAEVYIIHSSIIASKPAWLTSYTKTNAMVENSLGKKFDVLVKRFHRGDTVSLGANGNRDMPMYIVAVKPTGVAPALPQPKGKVFDIIQYGAKGDNKTLNTKFIQHAIDDCSAAGGGSVFIHDGIFITGTITLKANVTFFVQAGAVLRGSSNSADYPEYTVAMVTALKKKNYQLIFAEKSDHITITGGGIIDGYSLSGGWPWPLIMDNPDRPRIIRMAECNNVSVSNITLIRSAFWVQLFEACDTLREEHVRIRTYTGQHNLDGIDIDGCKNVEVSDYYCISGDDAVCLKADNDRVGENIYVHDVLIRHCNTHAIKIGTGTKNDIRNVLVKNVVASSRYGAAIECVDGGTVENIVYDNFNFSECGVPIFIRLGQRGTTYPGGPDPAPLSRMRNITVKNITNKGIGYVDTRGGPGVGSVISGIPGQEIENLVIENCDFLYYGSLKDTSLVYRNVPENEKDYPEFNIIGVCPAYGLYTRHVKNVTYRNIKIRSLNLDVRPAIVFDEVKGYTLSNINCESYTITEPFPVWHKQDGKLSPEFASDKTTGKQK